MCTGRTHAMQGAITGLAVPALYPTIFGYTPTVPAILLGAVLGAGGALLPDLDMSCSTASGSFGPVTDWVSRGVRVLSRAAFQATATRADRARTKGTHRGLTHMMVAAATIGLGAAGLASFGMPAALAVVFVVAFLALRGLPPVAHNLTDAITAGALTAGAWLILTTQPVPGWWIGDAMTTHGVPLLWPLPLAGQRWRPLGTPRFLRFETGRGFESTILLWANTVVLALLLVDLTPGGHEGFAAMLHHAGTA